MTTPEQQSVRPETAGFSDLTGRWPQRVASLAQRAREDPMARATVYLVVTALATSALGYLYWVVAARMLGAAAMGRASVSISTLTVASLLANLGGYSALVQRLPARTRPREWSQTITAVLVLILLASAVCGVAGVLVVAAASHGEPLGTWTELLLVVAAVAGTTVCNLLDYVWISERRGGTMLAFNVLFASAKIVLLFCPHGSMRNDIWILATWTAAMVLAAIGSAIAATFRLGLCPVPRGLLAELRQIRSLLGGHHLSNVANVVPSYVIPILVGLRLAPTSAGYFYGAWRIGALFVIVGSAMSSALLAEASRRPDQLPRRIRRDGKLLMAAVLVMTLLVLAFHTPVLRLMGPGFAAQASTVLVLLALAALPDAVTAIAGSVFRLLDRLRIAVYVSVAVAVAELTLCWLLLPVLGIDGAAVAVLTAQACAALILLSLLRAKWHVIERASASRSCEAR